MSISDDVANIFEKRIEVPSLNLNQRLDMLRFVLDGLHLQVDDDKWIDIALRSSGFNLKDYKKLAKNV